MKRITVILLLLPSLVFSKARLWVTIENCKEHSFAGIPENIQVFKNGVYASELTDSLKGKSFVMLENIDTGNYRFHYSNTFHYEVQENINISESKIYMINLCLDKFNNVDKSFRSLIDSADSNHPLVIKVNTISDYGSTTSELKIVKVKEKIIAYYKKNLKSKDKPASNVYKTKLLNPSDILLIRQFEHELTLITKSNMMCSAREYYSLQLGEIHRSFFDPTCEWQGIWNLLKKIFPK